MTEEAPEDSKKRIRSVRRAQQTGVWGEDKDKKGNRGSHPLYAGGSNQTQGKAGCERRKKEKDGKWGGGNGRAGIERSD